jgi:hypothetical protein
MSRRIKNFLGIPFGYVDQNGKSHSVNKVEKVGFFEFIGSKLTEIKNKKATNSQGVPARLWRDDRGRNYVSMDTEVLEDDGEPVEVTEVARVNLLTGICSNERYFVYKSVLV